MDKNEFWALIQEARDACGQDQETYIDCIHDRLIVLPPEEAQDFHDIIHAYKDLAHQYGLWDAAGIMKEYGCGSDGFLDFRYWLISKGKEVYLAALKDPDTLSSLEPDHDCNFEVLGYVGDYCMEELTGESAFYRTDQEQREALRDALKQEIVYGKGIEEFRDPMTLPQYLPKLCKRYGVDEACIAQHSPWNEDLERFTGMWTPPPKKHKDRGSYER